jgi:hypothetical protein
MFSKKSSPESPQTTRENDLEAIVARKPSNSTLATSSSNQSSHSEKHGKYNEFMRDAIIGFADGLTVPFALTAGLSA